MASRVLALLLTFALATSCASQAPAIVLEQSSRFGQPTSLPERPAETTTSLIEALAERRSAREFSAEPLGIDVIGQLFWAAQGITDDQGRRTAPSAGARFPLEIYAVTETEVLHYLPEGHRVEIRTDGRAHDGLAGAAFGQGFVEDAPVVLVISAVASRTEQEYGAVAADLINREAGHAAQNVLLLATALDLAAVPVGGFDPDDVATLLAFTAAEEPLYLIPVGHEP